MDFGMDQTELDKFPKETGSEQGPVGETFSPKQTARNRVEMG